MSELTPQELMPEIMALLGGMFANPFPTDEELNAIVSRMRALIGQVFMMMPDTIFEEIVGMLDMERERRRMESGGDVEP